MFGPGMLESFYCHVLVFDLRTKRFLVEHQKRYPIVFEGRVFRKGFRADLVVAGSVIVEVKSVARLDPVFHKQLLTYLRISGIKVGLLLNFGENSLRIKRIVNDY